MRISERPGARSSQETARRAALVTRSRPGDDAPVARARPRGSARAATLGVVRGHHQREGELALQRLDQIEHALGGVGVEVAGRLVAEQQLGALRERARDRDALRLASGQLAGQRVELGREPDQLEQLLRRVAELGRRAPPSAALALASRAKATFSYAVKWLSRLEPWKT